MADTPAPLRGNLYPTARVARCPFFDPCAYCKACTRHNPHAVVCGVCERRKDPRTLCRHTDDMQARVVQINAVLRRDMADPNQTPERVQIPLATNPDWERIVDGLADDTAALGRLGALEDAP